MVVAMSHWQYTFDTSAQGLQIIIFNSDYFSVSKHVGQRVIHFAYVSKALVCVARFYFLTPCFRTSNKDIVVWYSGLIQICNVNQPNQFRCEDDSFMKYKPNSMKNHGRKLQQY